MRLVIANKNYSSWSLRAWLVLTEAGIPFDEDQRSLLGPGFGADLPARRVPVLYAGELVIWDSLAIAEHLAETFPAKQLWPRDAGARAHARCICAEMHAGFAALRSRLPMNCELALRGIRFDRAVERDIARVVAIWQDTRARFGAGGPLLFGAFTIADAYFAPVVLRFQGYGVELPAVARAYADAVLALPSLQRWVAAGTAEHEFVADDEPYRDHR
jgi:glutathione S-transferase|nr:glutathione S-transferase family protein [Kofleriaceae bacterium]